MKFMIMIKSKENIGPPPKALMDAIANAGEEAMKAGTLVQIGGLGPTAMASRVQLRRGALNVTDGPFTEAKEVVGGFAVWDVKSKDDAVKAAVDFMELHKKHWPDFEGEAEVRQLFG